MSVSIKHYIPIPDYLTKPIFTFNRKKPTSEIFLTAIWGGTRWLFRSNDNENCWTSVRKLTDKEITRLKDYTTPASQE